MIIVLIYMIVGWLFSFVGLDELANKLLGFNTHQYYLVWFLTGALVSIRSLFSKNQ